MGTTRSKFIYTQGNNRKLHTLQKQASHAIPHIQNSKTVLNKNIPRNDKNNSNIEGAESIRETNQYKPWLSFKNVSCEKDRWQPKTHIRPKGIKCSCKSKTLSTNIPDRYNRIFTRERLACKNRPAPGLFPHTHFKCPQAVPESHLQPGNTAVDCAAFRSFFGSPDICSSYQLGGREIACTGCAHTSLFGRLSSSPPRQICSSFSCLGDSGTPVKPGVASEFPEIYTEANSGTGILRSSLEYSHQSQISACKQSRKDKTISLRHTKKRTLLPETDSVSTRLFKFCQSNDSARAPTLSPHTEISKNISTRQTQAKEVATNSSCTGTYVVAKGCRSQFNDSPQRADNPLPHHRCSRHRVGGPTKRALSNRNMETTSETVALKFKRDVRCVWSNKQTRNKPTESTHTDSVRQQDSDSICEKRGWHSFSSTAKLNHQTDGANRSPEYHPICGVSPGEVQRHSRPPIKRQTCAGMAPVAPGLGGLISKMGRPRRGPVCVQKVGRGATVRHLGLKRWLCNVLRRIQSKVAVSTGVGIPSTQLDTTCAPSAEHSRGDLHLDSSTLDTVCLAPRHQGESTRGTSSNTGLTQKPGGPNNQPDTSTSGQITTPCLENWGWANQIAQWTVQEKDLLKRSWRPSTLITYKAPIERWITWCHSQDINNKAPDAKDVARFLAKLYLEDNLAYSTILVHKSAVATYCATSTESISKNFFVQQILKSISQAKPQSKKIPIWDTKLLFDWLKMSPDSNSLFDISRKTALILLLASGRRLHDLTLLDMSEDNISLDEDTITLWPKFGSKTDNSNHRQSGWLLKVHPDSKLCPVKHLKDLIKFAQVRRVEVSDLSSLFISVTGVVKPATKTIISGWIKSIFKEVNIDAPPGSIRSAVASKSWLESRPLEEILNRGNWKSSETFRKYYCRQVNRRSDTSQEDLLLKNFSHV